MPTSPSRDFMIQQAVLNAALVEQPRLINRPFSVPGYINARSLAGYMLPQPFADEIRRQFHKIEATYAA